ncbi:MAG: hypothetical protein ACK5MY_02430 [Jhaorihella sp.]
MVFTHSRAWRAALTGAGIPDSKLGTTDELLTDTHWHLYVIFGNVPNLFSTVVTQELGDDDPRVPAAYKDMAIQAIQRWIKSLENPPP